MCCPQFSVNLEVDLDNDPGSFGGSATNRKCTDVWGFIPMVLFFGAVIALSAYCISNSEVEKLLNGYDDNGNICGKDNARTVELGKNMELKKYVLITEDAQRGKTKECVENCTTQGASLVDNYCVTDEKFLPFFIEMKQHVLFYVLSWFLVVIYTALQMKFIHKSNKDLALTKLFYLLSVSCLLSMLIRAIPSDPMKNQRTSLLIFFMVLAIFILILLYYPWLWKKKKKLKEDLIVHLFEEVLEATNRLTFWVLPLLSSIIITGFVVTVIFCCLWLQSFSYPETIYGKNGSQVTYIPYPIATATQALVIYAACLLYELVKNFQCMIIGGYVAEWYFTRRDGAAPDPIKRSLVKLLKYHLGTLCWGSILLPIIYVLRTLMNGIKGAASGYNNESVCTCSCRLLSQTCLSAFLPCLDFFSQNAFIMTSMSGCNFCAGTIRAHKLISHNSYIASINTFQYEILEHLRMAYMYLYFVCFWILYWFYSSKDLLIMTICNFVFSYILADCFTSAFKVTKDAIFHCFCEDCLYNNGTSKPYHMSKNFAQFVENANQFVDPVKWKDSAEKWEKGPKRLY